VSTSTEQVLERVKTRGAVGDALLRDSTVLSLSFESGRLKGSTLSQEAGLNLRIVSAGKVGTAGTTDLTLLDDLVSRAFASSAEGESVALEFPSRSTPPAVLTWADDAAGADVAALTALGRSVIERLAHEGWQINASVERHLEHTWFGNTAGQLVEQRATAVTVSAEVTRVAGDDVLMAYDVSASSGMPADADLDLVVRTILTKIERSLKIVDPLQGRLPVLFTTQGLSAVLMPVNQGLSGKQVLQGISPLGGKLGQKMFDASFSLTDDPLLDGRVASRGADDEGVVSRRLPLIANGVVSAFVYDLETASRAGAHSRRGVAAARSRPRAGGGRADRRRAGKREQRLVQSSGRAGLARGCRRDHRAREGRRRRRQRLRAAEPDQGAGQGRQVAQRHPVHPAHGPGRGQRRKTLSPLSETPPPGSFTV